MKKEKRKDTIDIQCPIEPDVLKIKLPDNIPKGNSRVYMEAYNKDDEYLACIRAHADFTKLPDKFLQLDNHY